METRQTRGEGTVERSIAWKQISHPCSPVLVWFEIEYKQPKRRKKGKNNSLVEKDQIVPKIPNRWQMDVRLFCSDLMLILKAHWHGFSCALVMFSAVRHPFPLVLNFTSPLPYFIIAPKISCLQSLAVESEEWVAVLQWFTNGHWQP